MGYHGSISSKIFTTASSIWGRFCCVHYLGSFCRVTLSRNLSIHVTKLHHQHVSHILELINKFSRSLISSTLFIFRETREAKTSSLFDSTGVEITPFHLRLSYQTVKCNEHRPDRWVKIFFELYGLATTSWYDPGLVRGRGSLKEKEHWGGLEKEEVWIHEERRSQAKGERRRGTRKWIKNRKRVYRERGVKQVTYTIVKNEISWIESPRSRWTLCLFLLGLFTPQDISQA